MSIATCGSLCLNILRFLKKKKKKKKTTSLDYSLSIHPVYYVVEAREYKTVR